MKLSLSENNERLCRELGGLFSRAGESLYLVGGAVRDGLLGRGRESDLDFTTSASPERIQKIVRPAATVCYDKSGAKGYGTMGVRLRGGPEVEITPFRLCGGLAGEAATPGQGDVRAETLEQDLQGRDFTINAMAVDLSRDNFGEIIDPCGGAADMSARLLRTPLEPEKTFEDDPLRLLRAVRFAAAFGLRIDDSTLETLSRMAALRPCALERTAPERVREELLHMLGLEKPSEAFKMLRRIGLLAIVLPEIDALADMRPQEGMHHKDIFLHTLATVDYVRSHEGGDDAILALGALMHDIGKPGARRIVDGEYSFHGHSKIGAELADAACKRLRLSNAQAGRVRDLVLLHHRLAEYKPEWTDAALRRAVHVLGEHYESELAIAFADITTSDADKAAARRADVEDFDRRRRALEDADQVLNPRPPIDGHEIMGLLGLETGGPEIGLAVNHLKNLIIEGLLDPTDAEAARKIVLSGEWRQ